MNVATRSPAGRLRCAAAEVERLHGEPALSWAHALDTKTPLPDTAETCGAHAVPCSFLRAGAQNGTVRVCRDLFLSLYLTFSDSLCLLFHL